MRTILPIKEEPENIPIYSNPSSEKGAAAAVVANLSGNKVLPLHIAGCHLLVLLFKFILLKSRKRLLEILSFLFFSHWFFTSIFILVYSLPWQLMNLLRLYVYILQFKVWSTTNSNTNSICVHTSSFSSIGLRLGVEMEHNR